MKSQASSYISIRGIIEQTEFHQSLLVLVKALDDNMEM